jgi:TRAP-type uncharacterized transport system substrate-binding protein
MKYFLISILFLITSLQAKDLGTIATASKTGSYYKLATDISSILKEYDLDLEPVETAGSYENISILNGTFLENKNTYFAIVQKDVIAYYNYMQFKLDGKGILSKIPAVLSLGTEQIHILALEDNEYDFEQRKEYKVYCGDIDSGSCVSAKYIEKAYNFKFEYINSVKENSIAMLEEGVVDLIISVIKVPSEDFKNLEGIKFVDLPTNFIMEDMYTHSFIKKEDYSWVEEEVHSFAVAKVLITNLTDKKYDPIIETIVKILVLNKDALGKDYGEYWNEIDFNYTNYKKFSKASKRVLESLK